MIMFAIVALLASAVLGPVHASNGERSLLDATPSHHPPPLCVMLCYH